MAQINIKIDDQLKDDVSKIFNEMGLDITTGIKVYLKRVQRDGRIPFDLTSKHFDTKKLAKRYHDGDPEVVSSLNDLIDEINKHKDPDVGVGQSVLNHHDDSPANGIGGTILKKTLK